MPSRIVLGRRAVHDGIGPRLELPSSLTGCDHEGSAAEPPHGRLERGQGAKRRIQEYEAEHLAPRAPVRPVLLEGLREGEEIDDLSAIEVGEVQEALHAEIFDRASRRMSTCPSFRM